MVAVAVGVANERSLSSDVTWIIRNRATGEQNMDVQLPLKIGDKVKIRLFNDPMSMHPMQHPIHIHGQRFLVIDRNGVPEGNLAWKDTILVPAGEYVDILVDVTNPGEWMMHCHIAEHLTSGMMVSFLTTNDEYPSVTSRETSSTAGMHSGHMM